jgi:hypothetical protein
LGISGHGSQFMSTQKLCKRRRKTLVDKYVTKEGAWWGVKLVGQRHPAFNDFKLE